MALILIDLDDTTVEFLNGILEIHNSKLPNDKHVTFEDLNCWDRNGEFIKPYINIEGLFLNLKIKENAVEVLKELNERHDIKFLTAFPTALSAKEKVEFVEKHFPFIGVRNTILTWCKEDVKGDLLFDDSPAFIPKFEGIKVVFDKPYNKHIFCDARVKSWAEFHKVILDLEDRWYINP